MTAPRTLSLGAGGLDLPLATAATQVYAFMGRRGSGKTYAAGRLVEQLLEHDAQVVIIDPVGVWWGLRYLAGGKEPSGLNVPVFGGWHGDLPLPPTAGKVFAELIANRSTSLVLDVSDMTGADQRRFVADLCTELFHAKKRSRSPVLVVFEEAQEFVPQHVRGEVAKMVGAVERLIKLGRNYGIGAALISQRPQAVNKDVLNQAEVMLAFQLTGPQERKAIMGWVQQTGAGDREIADDLPALPPGTALVWSPQWLGKFGQHAILKKRTMDASATPDGRGQDAARHLPPIDLDEVRTALKAVEEDIADNDSGALKLLVGSLKAEVARLRREALKKAAPIPPLAAAKEIDRLEAYTTALKAETDRQGANLLHALAAVQAGFGNIRRELSLTRGQGARVPDWTRVGDTVTIPAAALEDPVHAGAPAILRKRKRVETYGTPPGPKGPTVGTASDLDGGCRRVLGALVTRGGTLTLAQIAVLTRMHPKGTTLRRYVSKLASLGLVERVDGGRSVRMLNQALATRNGELPPPTKAALVSWWKAHPDIEGRAKDILEMVASEHELPLKGLAETLGIDIKGTTLRRYMRDLVGFGLVKRSDGGRKVKINPELAL